MKLLLTSIPPPALSGSGIEQNCSWVYSQLFSTPLKDKDDNIYINNLKILRIKF